MPSVLIGESVTFLGKYVSLPDNGRLYTEKSSRASERILYFLQKEVGHLLADLHLVGGLLLVMADDGSDGLGSHVG